MWYRMINVSIHPLCSHVAVLIRQQYLQIFVILGLTTFAEKPMDYFLKTKYILFLSDGAIELTFSYLGFGTALEKFGLWGFAELQ